MLKVIKRYHNFSCLEVWKVKETSCLLSRLHEHFRFVSVNITLEI